MTKDDDEGSSKQPLSTPPDSDEEGTSLESSEPSPSWKRRFLHGYQEKLSNLKSKVTDFAQDLKTKTVPFFRSTRTKTAGWMQQSPFGKKTLERVYKIKGSDIVAWANQWVEKRGGWFYVKIGTVLLCTYFLADIAGILISGLVPEPPAVRDPFGLGGNGRKARTFGAYEIILSRNLFNSADKKDGLQTLPGVEDLPAEKTNLPINLIGTIILTDPFRSVGTIEDKSTSTVYPVRVEDEIPTKIKIIKIEPDRITFINLSNRKKEYTELPDSAKKANNPTIRLGPKNMASTGIEAVAPNAFVIQKGEVDKALSDINNILTQARAVPNFENGVPNGYKLFQIVPGSIYDKLGLVNGDVILAFNNQALTDPGKAFEQLSELKNMKHLEIQMKRDGKPVTQVYDFQ